MKKNIKSLYEIEYKLFPSVVPEWDNKDRKPDNPTLVLNDNWQEYFEAWIKKVINDFIPFS